jgi:hypothetical protein
VLAIDREGIHQAKGSPIGAACTVLPSRKALAGRTRLKTFSALLLSLAVTLDFTAVTAAADPPRKASTILSNPVVWKSNDLRELVRSGSLSSTDIAALSGGREGLPWGIQSSNKRLCADEQLAATPARIELKVGEAFPMNQLILNSTAFGDFYYDAMYTRTWKFETDHVVFDKSMQALRGTSAGESELTVVSLCKAKGLTSKPAMVTVLIVVQPAS